MARKKHTHKYQMVNIAGQDVWACALDDCSHYMPYHLRELVPGKGSLSWSCNNKFILHPDAMKNKRPICTQCALKERGIDINGDIDEVIEMIRKQSEQKAIAEQQQSEEK